MTLEIGDRPAAHEREPAVQPGYELPKQWSQSRRNPDRVRRFRQLDEGAVEIEEKGGAFEQGQRRRRKVHAAPVGKCGRKSQAASDLESIARIHTPDVRLADVAAAAAHFKLAPIP